MHEESGAGVWNPEWVEKERKRLAEGLEKGINSLQNILLLADIDEEDWQVVARERKELQRLLDLVLHEFDFFVWKEAEEKWRIYQLW